jgi:hypothetical protein
LVVAGELGAAYAPAFEGMDLRSERGDTVISGPFADRSELRGLLERIESLALELVSVEPTARARRDEVPSRGSAVSARCSRARASDQPMIERVEASTSLGSARDDPETDRGE